MYINDEELACLVSRLTEIYEMGDQDECSVKHIAHALCAIRAGRNWDDVEDYFAPDCELYREDELRLEKLWLDVTEILAGKEPQKLSAIYALPEVYSVHHGYAIDSHISDMY